MREGNIKKKYIGRERERERERGEDRTTKTKRQESVNGVYGKR